MTHEIVTVETNALATTDKKGNRVSFERSIAFASKDERLKLAATVYERQVNGGTFGPIIRDALAAGMLSKSQREIVDAMLLASGRNPNKPTCIAVVQIILAAWSTKEAKGQKAFYLSLVRSLNQALAEPVAAQAGEVVNA